MNINKLFLTIILALATILGVNAQQFTLKGEVIDAETGKALSEVNIVIAKQEKGTVSTHSGTFEFKLSGRSARAHIFASGICHAKQTRARRWRH